MHALLHKIPSEKLVSYIVWNALHVLAYLSYIISMNIRTDKVSDREHSSKVNGKIKPPVLKVSSAVCETRLSQYLTRHRSKVCVTAIQ